MKPPVQYAMMPPRVDAPKVGKMKPVQQPKVAKMRSFDEALDYYLGPTGIPDKLRAVNSMLNPVETLGGSMRASQRLFAPETDGWGRVQAAGDMLSGIGGFVAPMVAAAKVGDPVASAVVDAFTGISTAPATQAAKTTATDFAVDESGAFAGLGAKGADVRGVGRAINMLDAGASRDEVWRETGWMRGVDGQWRFEIDDSGMALARGMPHETKMKRGTLGTGIKHPDLFAAYPDMQEMAFKPGYDMDNASAAYSASNNSIEVNRVGPAWGDKRKFKSATAHEAQHAIQNREGFARGGNPGQFYPEELLQQVQELDGVEDDLLGKSWREADPVKKAELVKLSQEAGEKKRALRKQANDWRFDQYTRLAGEVEARNVETRLPMTAAERRANPPWTTQDVPDEQQIVRKAIRLGQ